MTLRNNSLFTRSVQHHISKLSTYL
jgi:hypothetical protein